MFTVFVRNWWRWETSKFSGERKLVPDPGAKRTRLGKAKTEEEARAMCEAYNATHKPGKLSRKAEYTRD